MLDVKEQIFVRCLFLAWINSMSGASLFWRGDTSGRHFDITLKGISILWSMLGSIAGDRDLWKGHMERGRGKADERCDVGTYNTLYFRYYIIGEPQNTSIGRRSRSAARPCRPASSLRERLRLPLADPPPGSPCPRQADPSSICRNNPSL